MAINICTKVSYVADQDGFHVDPSVLPVASPVSHPHVGYSNLECLMDWPTFIKIQDTAAVSRAKLQHQELYTAIALRNSQAPAAPQVLLPAETPAVAEVRTQFASQFEKIAAEHARIAAEHEDLAREEERLRQISSENWVASHHHSS